MTISTSAPAPPSAPASVSDNSPAHRIASVQAIGPILALVLASAYFWWKTDTFMTVGNWSTVANQVGYLGVLAIGQTLIILTAGIDLANGVSMAMGAMVTAKLAMDSGVAWPLAMLAGIAVCAFIGFVNGSLIRFAKLPPFIVTLGMYGIAYMAVHVYSNNQTVAILDTSSPLVWLGRSISFGDASVTYGTLLAIALFAGAGFVLTQTSFGRHVYAFGDNPEAARLTGIRTGRLQISVYTVAGVLYGIAALISLARVGAAGSEAGQTENLETITAVVIGGTSLFGGRGTVIGTMVGAMIIGIFRNGLVQMGVRSEIQYGVTGALVILAVVVDQISKQKR